MDNILILDEEEPVQQLLARILEAEITALLFVAATMALVLIVFDQFFE